MTPTRRTVYAFFLLAVAIFLFTWLMPIMINVESTIVSTLGFLTGGVSVFLVGFAGYNLFHAIKQSSSVQQPKE
jgi:hypothetical protein